jgi:predicted ABC-type ATPase
MEKKWSTTGDNRVSELCLVNEDESWIGINQPHASGHMMPLRFPGCRCAELYRRKKDQTVNKVQEEIDNYIEKNKNSITKNQKNGVFTPKRKKRKALKGAKRAPDSEKTVFMSGGASANGKSTVLDSGKIIFPKNMVKVDSDAIKVMLPEYRQMERLRDSRAANFVHKESSLIGKDILKTSIDKNYNALLDGTGDGTIEELTKKVAGMRAKGHKVKADYVSLDTDLSFKLADIRAKKTGRVIPDDFLQHINQQVSVVFPEALEKKLFDDVRLWDTNINGVPRLILEQKNGVTTIYNQDLYNRFLAKANPNTDFSVFKHLDD